MKSCCQILIAAASALGGSLVIVIILVRWRDPYASSRPHWSGAC